LPGFVLASQEVRSAGSTVGRFPSRRLRAGGTLMEVRDRRRMCTTDGKDESKP
jgi:hypothetical protein